MVAALTMRQGDHPSCSRLNPCLNARINNPLSKVHCQSSLDPTQGGGRQRQIAKEETIDAFVRATVEDRWMRSEMDRTHQ